MLRHRQLQTGWSNLMFCWIPRVCIYRWKTLTMPTGSYIFQYIREPKRIEKEPEDCLSCTLSSSSSADSPSPVKRSGISDSSPKGAVVPKKRRNSKHNGDVAPGKKSKPVTEGRIGMRTRSSKGDDDEKDDILVSSRGWALCALCKYSTYKSIKPHLINKHGFRHAETTSLDSQRDLYQYSVGQGMIDPQCLLCDASFASYDDSMAHYTNYHQITNVFPEKAKKGIEKTIQPPCDLYQLVSLVYEARHGEYSAVVNNEVCSYIAEEFISNGLRWITDNDQEQLQLPTFEEDLLLRVKVTENRMYLFNELPSWKQGFKLPESRYLMKNRWNSMRVWSLCVPPCLQFKVSGKTVQTLSLTTNTDRETKRKDAVNFYNAQVAKLPPNYQNMGFPVPNLPTLGWLFNYRRVQDDLWSEILRIKKSKIKIEVVTPLDLYSHPIPISNDWLKAIRRIRKTDQEKKMLEKKLEKTT